MRLSFEKSPVLRSGERCTRQLLLLFLTGNLLGGLMVRYFDLSVSPGLMEHSRFGLGLESDFLSAFGAEAKFLFLVFLLGFQRWGAAFVPPVFGIEGLYYGVTVGGLMVSLGPKGGVLAFILLLFRFVLILPYGFLLGGWAVEQSLRFPEPAKCGSVILVLTLFVMLLAAFLESSLARWLGGMYYLKFGV